MLIKKVNIYPTMPIIGLNPVVRTVTKNVFKSVDEIKICINARAIVEEILNDGSILRLNLSNYDKNNNVDKDTVVDEGKTVVEEVEKVEKAAEAEEQTDEPDEVVKTAEDAEMEENPSGEEAHKLFEGADYSEVEEPTDEKADITPDDEKGL